MDSTRICVRCEEQYTPTRKDQLYCSHRCYTESRRKRQPRSCLHCGQIFQPRADGTGEFCSHNCSNASRKNWTTKTCPQCGQDFLPAYHHRARQMYCSQSCGYDAHRQKERERRIVRREMQRAAHPEALRTQHRKEHLRERGLTFADFDRMFLAQDGRCAICSIHFAEGNARNGVAIDHCHESGRTRGLLCRRCNQALGFMDDDIACLRAAIAYLERWGERQE